MNCSQALARRRWRRRKAFLACGFRTGCVLYMVSDGVFDTVGQWFVIWPVGMLADQNTRLRNGGLLPGGTEDVFCMKPGQQDVSCWHPIDGSMPPLASDLATFWRGWADGTITT